MHQEMSIDHVKYFWFPIATLIKILISAVALGGGLELFFTSHSYFSLKKVIGISLIIFSIWQVIDICFFFKY